MNRIISSIISKRNEKSYNSYKKKNSSYYDRALTKICKIVIKYIPDDDEISKFQKKNMKSIIYLKIWKNR